MEWYQRDNWAYFLEEHKHEDVGKKAKIKDINFVGEVEAVTHNGKYKITKRYSPCATEFYVVNKWEFEWVGE